MKTLTICTCCRQPLKEQPFRGEHVFRDPLDLPLPPVSSLFYRESASPEGAILALAAIPAMRGGRGTALVSVHVGALPTDSTGE